MTFSQVTSSFLNKVKRLGDSMEQASVFTMDHTKKSSGLRSQKRRVQVRSTSRRCPCRVASLLESRNIAIIVSSPRDLAMVLYFVLSTAHVVLFLLLFLLSFAGFGAILLLEVPTQYKSFYMRVRITTSARNIVNLLPKSSIN